MRGDACSGLSCDSTRGSVRTNIRRSRGGRRRGLPHLAATAGTRRRGRAKTKAGAVVKPLRKASYRPPSGIGVGRAAPVRESRIMAVNRSACLDRGWSSPRRAYGSRRRCWPWQPNHLCVQGEKFPFRMDPSQRKGVPGGKPKNVPRRRSGQRCRVGRRRLRPATRRRRAAIQGEGANSGREVEKTIPGGALFANDRRQDRALTRSEPCQSLPRGFATTYV